MKVALLLLLLLVAAAPMLSQEEDTHAGDTTANGGFGGPVMKVGSINGSSAIFIGGKGCWTINGTVSVGGGGYILTSNVATRTTDTSGSSRLMMAYGGIEVEYVKAINRLLHLTFDALIGAGSIGYEQNTYLNPREHHDGFFVVEPGINIDLTVTTFFRVGGGVSYRHVLGLSSGLSANADLSGPSAILTLKFGAF